MSATMPTLFLHSTVPGVTPYCGGRHVWGDVVRAFGAGAPASALTLDLPGSGDNVAEGALTVDAMAEYAARHIRSLGVGKVRIVGHDVAALVALVLAMDHAELVSSITVVSSVWAAPSGDGVEDYTLRSPPPPLWSRQSQQWALEQVSYSHQHIDAALLDACVKAAAGPAHQAAVKAMSGDGLARTFLPSAARAKYRFFQLARGEGLKVPMQVIAGQNDPLVSPMHMITLFRIVADKQKQAQFHLINRAGSLPFREQPDEFVRLVAAFADGLDAENARAGLAA